MTTKKLTKLLALYLPYILLGLAATNFGEAWRLAEGKELGDKIMSMMGTIPVAFANPLPSLHPLDLLVGLCCGTGLRLAVYLRGKNAKKYRHGMEYGSARWGNAKDIEPFMAPKFSDNIILTKTERLMMSNRPPDPKNARNKNVLVVGGSGSGKTRFWLKPNLLQCHSSYVVTDPKGTIVLECGNAMLKNGSKAYLSLFPSDLATYGRDAKALLKELQSQNERMFLVTFLVLNTGRTEQELENNVFQASSIAQKHNCNLCRLDFQQEQGLMSSLPLADCQIEIQRGLTTSSTAIFIPFTTQELYQSGKESLYYGLNALSNNLIMVDRKKLKNPNGLILGTPGSGKSFSAKREITNAFLVTDDDIIICDPEAEYAPLVERLHGQVIHIGPASTQYINPMDINSNYSEEDNPLALKADFILSLCELVVGGKEGLQPVEKTVIDRCVHVVYRKYFENPTPENMPLLEDLYNALLTQDEPEARHVAAALEIYVKGSLNIFNHHTNVDIHNRIVCFDIKQLGKQLKKLGMLIVQDAVWGRVTANRSAGKSTRYYADEFHLLLKEEQTAAYSVEIWKRFRKWGGIPTALTQNVKDLLASPEVSNIFENSDFVYMLNQANGDRQILAKQLNISPHQLSYVTHSGEGEGLLFFGNVILPFVDHFPKDLELYRILTTKLNEISEGTQK